MELAEKLKKIQVMPGELAVCWLGQAGFYLKDEYNTGFVIDPYLTDCGERIKGFKRISPMLIQPSELEADYYCITHTHFDHFDYDAIPEVEAHSHPVFLGPESCMAELEKFKIPKDRRRLLRIGSCEELDTIKIRAVRADHGALSPDAVGILLEMGGHCLYFTGDSAYHEEWNREIASYHPDIACISINGMYGNMNAVQGGKTALETRVQTAIPCHFWTFAEHGGSPLLFCEYIDEISTKCRPLCMRHGEVWVAPAVK